MNTHPIHRAFTLIELMVSVALFSIVMTVVSAAYLNLVSLDKQARATDDLVNNLSFAVDTMARSIRTGTQYCSGTCLTSTFSFVDSSGCKITYALSNARLVESTKAGSTGTCATTNKVPLTDPAITISALTFQVNGVGTGDGIEPNVTFVIAGSLGADPNHLTTFNIETGATERGIDI